MQIGDIVRFLETVAPLSLQEGYDNAGLITGSAAWECKGILVSLDATEEVILEAKDKGLNLVVAHHPIVFSGLKKITGKTYVERAVIASIKHDIAIYAIHTNLDNVIAGVNAKMAERLGLVNCKILQPKTALLRKLFSFVPVSHAQMVRTAVFEAGGGHIGDYSECSFNAPGKGTFKGAAGTDPFVGEPGKLHEEEELKIEVIFPAWLENNIISAMLKHHPYEEPAYDIIQLSNEWGGAGSGIIGDLPEGITQNDFLQLLKNQFHLSVIRHTSPSLATIKKVALCGGAGSFLTKAALAAGADAFVTGDVKYHEFFDAENRLFLADIGHWESEQFTIDLLTDHLSGKFPTFAVLKTGVKTNPVEYYT
ncbi:MAG: Nif3-like dinuclear metal center hexameric protein [Lacibacter sp.]|nr:Nif3-like dinuclear metal center hexameric protein [Lacibacter sp.]